MDEAKEQFSRFVNAVMFEPIGDVPLIGGRYGLVVEKFGIKDSVTTLEVLHKDSGRRFCATVREGGAVATSEALTK